MYKHFIVQLALCCTTTALLLPTKDETFLALYKATKKQNSAEVEQILNKNNIDLTLIIPVRGCTILHMVIEQAGQNKNGRCPKYEEIFKLLLEHKADPNIPTATQIKHVRPLSCDCCLNLTHLFCSFFIPSPTQRTEEYIEYWQTQRKEHNLLPSKTLTKIKKLISNHGPDKEKKA